MVVYFDLWKNVCAAALYIVKRKHVGDTFYALINWFTSIRETYKHKTTLLWTPPSFCSLQNPFEEEHHLSSAVERERKIIYKIVQT